MFPFVVLKSLDFGQTSKVGVDPKNKQLEINLYYILAFDIQKVIPIEYIYVPAKIMLKIIHLNNTTNICPNTIVRVCGFGRYSFCNIFFAYESSLCANDLICFCYLHMSFWQLCCQMFVTCQRSEIWQTIYTKHNHCQTFGIKYAQLCHP